MSYIDVYTLEDYQQRVMELSSKVSSLNDEAEIIKREDSLMQQIEVLEAKEQQIFSILGVRSIEELNQRLQEFQSAVFNLSGQQLYSHFLKLLTENQQKISSQFSEDVQNIVAQALNEEGISYAALGKEGIISLIGQLLKQNTQSGRLKIGKGVETEKLIPSKFTKAQKKRWEQLILKAKSREGISYCGQNGKNIKIYLEDSGQNNFSATFDWYFATNNLTKTEAREIYSTAPHVLQEINNKMVDFIVSHVSSHQEIVRNIVINKILARDPYAFFVGQNINDITGLLGKIQGLYYLHVLTGGKSTTNWVGGITANGKKPHRDIVLNEFFGIQIKNTTKDLLQQSLNNGMTVGFQSATLSHFLSQLHTSSYFQEVFEEFYGTKMFNVPYKIEDGRYVSGSDGSDKAKIFQGYKNNLDNLTGDVEAALQGFAATFMYLDVETEVLRMYDGNSLFLLGGTMFVTASWMLTQVLGELRTKRHRFRVRASFSDTKSIIEALNEKRRAPDYSKGVLNKVVLNTSFTF